MAKKKNPSSEGVTAVLVAPREDPKALLRWAETELKDRPVVIFIGVDGGLEVLLKSDLPVGLAIGDWDSLESKKSLVEVSAISLKAKKDQSDLFYALKLATSLGATDLVAYGFQGGAFDQELGVLLDLVAFASKFRSLGWVGPRARGEFLVGRAERKFDFKKGQAFSVFALAGSTAGAGSEARGVSIAGAEYSLKSSRLAPSSRGLSNLARGPVKVSVARGVLLVLF